MERYSMKADNIKNIISDIDHLPYRAILFDGTWGIGKSYAVNEALEANPNVCKISMFGLKDPKQIYHEALFQLALKNNIGGKIGEITNNVLDGLSKIWDKVGQAKEVVQSIANSMLKHISNRICHFFYRISISIIRINFFIVQVFYTLHNNSKAY